jgi:hypothetical protein
MDAPTAAARQHATLRAPHGRARMIDLKVERNLLPATRNRLEKSSVAQCLDGTRLKGRLRFPLL